MIPAVDSFRYVDPVTRQIVKSWISRERFDHIPWTPLPGPLAERTVALVSSAALARDGQPPFDRERERQNPWWGDPSFRVIPADVDPAAVRCQHLHIDSTDADADLDCVLPLTRLAELAEAGEIGAAASSHYSFQGYLLDAAEFLGTSVPRMIDQMRDEGVDAVVLVPV